MVDWMRKGEARAHISAEFAEGESVGEYDGVRYSLHTLWILLIRVENCFLHRLPLRRYRSQHPATGSSRLRILAYTRGSRSSATPPHFSSCDSFVRVPDFKFESSSFVPDPCRSGVASPRCRTDLFSAYWCNQDSSCAVWVWSPDGLRVWCRSKYAVDAGETCGWWAEFAYLRPSFPASNKLTENSCGNGSTHPSTRPRRHDISGNMVYNFLVPSFTQNSNSSPAQQS